MSVIPRIIGSPRHDMSVMLAKLRQSRAAKVAGGIVVTLIVLDLAAMAATAWLGAELLRR